MNLLSRTSFGFFIGLVLCRASLATTPAGQPELAKVLQPLVDAHHGQVAVAVQHLQTGESFAVGADQVMPAASLIKLPVMVTAYHLAASGRIDLDEMLTLTEEDKVPGSGILTDHFSAGAQISLRDAIRLMIVYSDNTAMNLVVERIGLPSTREHMAALGLPETRLNSLAFRRDTSIDVERSEEYGLGSTTAAEMLRLLELLQAGRLGDEPATQEMLAHLSECEEDQKLTRFLPPQLRVAHKSGALPAVRCEAGILYCASGPVAVCVLTAENEDQSWQPENAGNRLCADVGLAVHKLFAQRGSSDGESFPETLARGTSGPIVATLQRTLNARLDPSPDLAVDGDFGPATQQAVQEFQRKNGLSTTGEVGEATWQRLEPLLTADPPVPDPAAINGRVLEMHPCDPLDGPPYVTCKAWAIADGRTGHFLWGDHADEPLDFASTTKIMTGYLVCRLAEQNPLALKETVVVSSRADETNGSTAGLRAGEQLTVRELLYGLMLPSGNDAAVALAEHLGGRVARTHRSESAHSGATPAERYGAFIEAMNHEAQELCMHKTGFRNPHGMTIEGHVTTCQDLLRLAHTAMQCNLFRETVATREHGVTVTGASGYHRNLLWKNTNRLLPIEGYLGIKTGTTTTAGACLVSMAKREERTLLLCVLGATSGDARYVDSRNLYRWAWKQLESK
jgi:D-alanyl-D-alanine carboxypeptidase (penicillin-binding protein 5/6)